MRRISGSSRSTIIPLWFRVKVSFGSAYVIVQKETVTKANPCFRFSLSIGCCCCCCCCFLGVILSHAIIIIVVVVIGFIFKTRSSFLSCLRRAILSHRYFYSIRRRYLVQHTSRHETLA